MSCEEKILGFMKMENHCNHMVHEKKENYHGQHIEDRTETIDYWKRCKCGKKRRVQFGEWAYLII